MKKLLLCLYLSATMQFLWAQTSRNQGLQIGDTIPDVYLGKTVQDNIPLGSIRNFKGRMILLDFWTTGCVGCIHGMPKVDTLQQVFGDNIKAIIVCNKKRVEVEQLFKAVRRSYPQTPIVLEDSVLNAWFPHKTVPHHVWIDGQGVIRYITYDWNATVENVRKFLNGETLHLSYRKQLTDFNSKVALFNEGKGRWNEQIKYYTLFATYLDGVEHTNPQLGVDTTRRCQVVRLINFPYRRLFEAAYNGSFEDGVFSLSNRWVIAVAQPQYLKPNEDVDSLIDQWNSRAIASYEAVLPGTNQSILFSAMRRDLNIYSPYTAHVEKRKVKCLILVNKGIKPSTHKNDDPVWEVENNGATKIVNYTIQQSILDQLRMGNDNLVTPIVDETRFFDKVDMNINIPVDNLVNPAKFKQVQEELNKNGLGFEYGERVLPMLVIKDQE